VSGRGRDVGGRDRDVGCCGRDLGGRDRSVGGRDRSVGDRDHSGGGRVADFVFRRFPSPTMAGNMANRDRTDGAMEQRPAANLERGIPAAVGVL
jgi:hypothetical protein